MSSQKSYFCFPKSFFKKLPCKAPALTGILLVFLEFYCVNQAVLTDDTFQAARLPFLSFEPQRTENAVVRLIRKARKSIEVSIYGLDNEPITDALIEAHQKGIRVRISSELDQAGGASWLKLINHNVPVRFGNPGGIMHNKYLIADRKYLLTGSANWTKGLFSHFNNAVIFNSPEIAEEYRQDFEVQFAGYYANKKDEGYASFSESSDKLGKIDKSKNTIHWNFTTHRLSNNVLLTAYFTPYKNSFPEYTENPGFPECSQSCLGISQGGSGKCTDQDCSLRACYKKGRQGSRNKIIHAYPNYDQKGVLYCTEYDNAMNRVIRLLQGAQSSILVLAFAFRDRLFQYELIQAEQRGLDVRILIDHNQYRSGYKQSRGSFRAVSQKTGFFRVCKKNDGGLLHHKVIVVDKQTVLLGSLNFSQNAVNNNDENFVIIENVPSLAQSFYKEASRITPHCYSLKGADNSEN